MATKAELTVPAADMALAETATVLDDGRFKVEETAFSDEAWSLNVWVPSVDEAVVAEALDADPTVSTYSLTEQRDGKTLVELGLCESLPVCDVIHQCDGTIFEAFCSDRTWTLEVRFPTRECLSDAAARFDERDVEVRYTTIASRQSMANAAPDVLTERQREVLETALSNGYFEIPRQLSLQELADECGISHQALSEILRRAEENLAESHLTPRNGFSTNGSPRSGVGE